MEKDEREWGVMFCVVKCRVWGVVWKGYEVKGVDGGSGYQNERIAGKTNSRWKGELKNESSSNDEKPESHYIFYESLQSENEYKCISLN